MLKVGDLVKWMSPLDHDYLYGKIVSIHNCIAIIKGVGLYECVTAEVHVKYVKKIVGRR